MTKGISNKLLIAVLLLPIIVINSAYSYSQFTNYTSAIQINDIVLDDEYAWAASMGGLVRLTLDTREVMLKSNTDNFPDLFCTAIAIDSEENLWIGTMKGYLYKVTPRERHHVFTSYVSDSDDDRWEITDLYCYGKYLFVGSTEGFSIFDTDEQVVVQNATVFGNFPSSVVNTIGVFGDSLFLGCNDGVAKISIAGSNITALNFADNSIWETISTPKGIKSFPMIGDSIIYLENVSAVWDSSLLYNVTIEHNDKTKDHYLHRDSVVWKKMSSEILTIIPDSEGGFWLGTTENSIYYLKNKSLTNYSVPEMITYRYVNRIYVARNSDVYTTPWVEKKNRPWWQGVARFSDDAWEMYRRGKPEDFGDIGNGDEFLGVAQDFKGNMWFGNNGRCIKRFKVKRNRWDGFFIGSGASSTFKYVKKNEGMKWGKCDAIARDSSDYMWFSVYEGDSGSLICYDVDTPLPNDKEYDTSALTFPSDTTYRFFLEKSSSLYMGRPKHLNVDAAGHIFVGDAETGNGRLLVFSHDGNPLDNGISKPIYDNNFSKIYNLSSDFDTTTWLVTQQGLYHYKYLPAIDEVDVVKVLGAPDNLNCIKIERLLRIDSAKVEFVVWGGTFDNGLMRIDLHKVYRADGSIDSIGIDSVSNITVKDGLISNHVTSIDIDRKKGLLWVGTQEGISRYDLGHSFVKIEDNRDIFAYPNPFIKSRHNQIVFDNCAPGSRISVYTVDGALVEQIFDKGNNVVKTSNEWTYTWEPKTKLLPGVYFYTARKQQIYGQNRDKAAIGKILVVP